MRKRRWVRRRSPAGSLSLNMRQVWWQIRFPRRILPTRTTDINKDNPENACLSCAASLFRPNFNFTRLARPNSNCRVSPVGTNPPNHTTTTLLPADGTKFALPLDQHAHRNGTKQHISLRSPRQQVFSGPKGAWCPVDKHQFVKMGTCAPKNRRGGWQKWRSPKTRQK